MGGRALILTLAVLAGLALQEERSRMEVIEIARCDGGSTTRFDPARVEKNYREASAELSRGLARFEKEAVAKFQDAYDIGLHDPVRSTQRTFKLSKPLPEQVFGLTIYVVTVDRGGAVRGLPTGAVKKCNVVLISRAARLKDCVSLAPVTFLTREMAAALELRVSRGRCVVSADGREIEVTEGDLP